MQRMNIKYTPLSILFSCMLACTPETISTETDKDGVITHVDCFFIYLNFHQNVPDQLSSCFCSNRSPDTYKLVLFETDDGQKTSNQAN